MNILWQPEVDQATCAHEWSAPFDGRINAEVGKPIREEWKVYCPRCGRIERREEPFTESESK